jgi:hypothetical protein
MSKRVWPLFSVIILVLFVSPACADISGNDLKEACDGPKGSTKFTYCMGYVAGALDTFRGLGKSSALKFFCEPRGVTGEQLILMAQKHLSQNPQDLHYGASSLLLNMMVSAFPCPKNSN